MQHLQANSHLLCNSCGQELGFIWRNVNVAQFIYCDECVKTRKFHSDDDFLQNWDKDIFFEPSSDFTLEGSDGRILRAHKAVRARKSKVFKTMSESVSGKLKISDMTAFYRAADHLDEPHKEEPKEVLLHETSLNMANTPIGHVEYLDVGGDESDSGQSCLCGLKRSLDITDS